ncbi:FkbM family methyltransferase [Paragemmobacter straminiformis]
MDAGDSDPSDDTETPKSKAELRAEALIRRQKRNLRKAHAEGYLSGVAAMLRKGDLALDLGANMGVVTDILARTGADVVAFEPDPWAFAKLTERFADTPNVTLVNAAVGIGSGTVRLMRAQNFGDNPLGASVKSTILDGGRQIDAENAVDVPLVDFPAYLTERLAERPEIAFVKMDIEGAELDILEALDAGGFFDRIRVLVAETHERKFRDLRPRFRALRQGFAAKYDPNRVSLDWI